MNRFIASNGSGQIATIQDDPEHHVLVTDTVTLWLQRGLMIHMEHSAPSAKPVTVVPAKRSYHRKPVAVKPSHNPSPVIAGSWKEGDKVYINWAALPAYTRVHLSQYRTTQGIVAELRSGKGIRKTVGVRFNDDPISEWFAPDELSHSLELGQ